MEAFYREFGRRLRQTREQGNVALTQHDLAERVGLSRTSITNIEKGKQHISLHMLFKLANALGIAPTELLPDPQFALPEQVSLATRIGKLPISRTNKELLQRTVSRG
jgi:transcriptional regulator with XRE-family HTH domain